MLVGCRRPDSWPARIDFSDFNRRVRFVPDSEWAVRWACQPLHASFPSKWLSSDDGQWALQSLCARAVSLRLCGGEVKLSALGALSQLQTLHLEYFCYRWSGADLSCSSLTELSARTDSFVWERKRLPRLRRLHLTADSLDESVLPVLSSLTIPSCGSPRLFELVSRAPLRPTLHADFNGGSRSVDVKAALEAAAATGFPLGTIKLPGASHSLLCLPVLRAHHRIQHLVVTDVAGLTTAGIDKAANNLAALTVCDARFYAEAGLEPTSPVPSLLRLHAAGTALRLEDCKMAVGCVHIDKAPFLARVRELFPLFDSVFGGLSFQCNHVGDCRA